MSKIIDIIHHKNDRFTQQFIVVDTYPEFIYEKKGSYLIGEDSGFFSFYGYETPSERWKAFGGREFYLKLDNGEIIHANGQWWASCPPDYAGLTISNGVSTIESLNRCNVFSSCNVDPQIVDDWLSENDPSNNYDKYRTGHENYLKHQINIK